jgi:hypothetical protein
MYPEAHGGREPDEACQWRSMQRAEEMPMLQPLAILRCPTVEQPVPSVDRPYREAQDDFIREGHSYPVGVSEQERPQDGNCWCVETEKVPPQPPRNRPWLLWLGTNNTLRGSSPEGSSGEGVRLRSCLVKSITGSGHGRSDAHPDHGLVGAGILRRMSQDFLTSVRYPSERPRSVFASTPQEPFRTNFSLCNPLDISYNDICSKGHCIGRFCGASLCPWEKGATSPGLALVS